MNPLDLLDQLAGLLSSAWWAYPLIALVVAGDAVVPVLPGETVLIAGGVLTVSAGLSPGGVLVAGALGALLGDSLAYLAGRRTGGVARRTVLAGRRAQQLFAWAQRQLRERGATVIALARFVPGGRTATAFTAGASSYGYRRFAPAAACGAVLWSAVNVLIGRIGGAAFEDSTWKSLALALTLALVLGTAIEAGRAWWRRRRPVVPPSRRGDARGDGDGRPAVNGSGAGEYAWSDVPTGTLRR